MLCENIQLVKNKYTGELVHVACRSCPSCLSEMANHHRQIIQNAISSEYSYYFVMLSYSNKYVPFVYLDSLGIGDVYSYRFSDCTHQVTKFYQKSPEVITSINDFNEKKYNRFESSLEYYIKSNVWYLKNMPASNCVAVHNPVDVQLFLKRLRKYLYKYNNYDNGFQYYASFEYGETTYRPHIHFLFKTKIPVQIFKAAIMSTWTYCDYSKLKRWFEIAISPAKYLSAYLGDSHFLPAFYKSPLFRQRFTHSLHFGFENPAFSLSSVFSNAEIGNVTYHVDFFTKKGFHYIDDLPVPSYVGNRWFPKFPGFSRINYHEYMYLGTHLFDVSDKAFEFFEYTWQTNSGKLFTVCSKQIDYDLKTYSLLFQLGLNSESVKLVYNAFRRMRFYASTLNIDYEYYLTVAFQFHVSLSSLYLKLSHKNDTSFITSYAYYLDLYETAPSELFTDIEGVVHTNQVINFLKNNYVIRSIHDSILKKSFESKNLKKIKQKTFDYYSYG